MKLEIKIEPTFSVKWPKMRLKFNDETLHDGYCEPNDDVYFVMVHDTNEVLANNTISIEHYDKDGKETVLNDDGDTLTDRAIILRSIKLDEHQVPEVILFDQPLHIKWTERQIRDHADRPDKIKNSLYFGHNGTYTYQFSNDSVKQHYVNLIEKERLANIANKKEIVRPDGKVVEAFEFTGKLVDSEEKESITIAELYKRVKDSKVDTL